MNVRCTGAGQNSSPTSTASCGTACGSAFFSRSESSPPAITHSTAEATNGACGEPNHSATCPTSVAATAPPEPAAEVVARAGDRARRVADRHRGAGEQRVQQPGHQPRDDDADDQDRLARHGQHQHQHGVAEDRGRGGVPFTQLRGQPRRERDPGDRDAQAPAAEDQADGDRVPAEDERRPGQHREERGGVQRRRDGGAQQALVLQRAQRVQQLDRRTPLALVALEEDRAQHERAGHQDRGAEERAAPRDRAEQRAQQRADRQADTQGGFVEQDRAGLAAGRGADDHRKRRRDEERVAEAPDRAQPDELLDRAGGRTQGGGRDDQRQPDQDGALRAELGARRAGDQHREDLDAEVGREEQGDLRRRRVQALGDGQQDRVDQADPHEGDDRGERGDPHLLGLALDGVQQARVVLSAHR